MKAKKLLKTLVASAMSLALMAGVTVMPAMAAAPSEGVATGNEFTTSSVLRVPDNIANPGITLTFTVSNGTVTEDEMHDSMLVYPGETNGLSVTGSVTYAACDAQAVVTGQNYYELSQTVTMTADVSKFAHAGVYKYTVTVTNNPAVTGVTVDTAKTVYVYVINGTNGLEVQAISMANSDGTKVNNFVSSYLMDNSQYGNLLVTKTVAGDFGDKKKQFTFTISVPAGLHYEYGTFDGYSFTPATGDGKSGLTQATNTFSLADGEAVMIYGLVNGTNYTVDETDYTAQGYTTSVTGVVDGQQGTITEGGDVTAAYTNTNDGTPATGIIMNVAPYALMVVIALAGVMVFMRKRVED